jgi:hypothetical protein
MDNHIISFLQNFEKPAADFLQGKECLICLETFDLETNQFLQLPCKCSNSVYHMDCILKLLNSGLNKNFCPHCKSKYEMRLQQIQTPSPTLDQENINLRTRKFSHILFIHILINSLMNVVNISLSEEEYDKNVPNIISKLLLICYFGKVLVNCFIVFRLKFDYEKIVSDLNFSYMIQTIIFILLIALLSIIKKNYNTIFIITNNLIFSFSDLAFRTIIECKITNRIYIA